MAAHNGELIVEAIVDIAFINTELGIDVLSLDDTRYASAQEVA
jgi:hypothetical protein